MQQRLKSGETARLTIQIICKTALLFMSAVFILSPLLPFKAGILTGISGAVILVSSIPLLNGSYRKPVYIFLIFSIFLTVRYRLNPEILLTGINSMLSIVAIMTVFQIFVVPIRAGRFDAALGNYLRNSFKSETALYIFISFITHIIGSFMLFGTVPMVYTFFKKPIESMVQEPKRFSVTSIGRSFSLITLWAPGAVSVVLVLESTGANWFQLFIPAFALTILGLSTSIILEKVTVIRKRQIIPSRTDSAGFSVNRRERRQILILIFVAAALLSGILTLQKLNLLTTTTRVLVCGFIIAGVWILRYRKEPGLSGEFRYYWKNSLSVVPDLAALFVSIGIFTAVIQNTPLMGILQNQLIMIMSVLGENSFFLITPTMILLSMIGIHPFISVVFLGKLFIGAASYPHFELLTALSLLLGGVISYSASPFAGNILMLSRFAGCSPRQAAFSWNGLFSLLFLAEGFIVLFIMKILLSV